MGLAYNYRFGKLLDKDQSFSIHHQNLQVLATEIYKAHPNIALGFIFKKKEETSCNLLNNAHFSQRNIKSEYRGTQIISCLRPEIWNLTPECIKDSKIKFWKLESCLRWLCEVYLPNAFFLIKVFSKFHSTFGKIRKVDWFIL